MEKMRSGVGGYESQVTSDLWRKSSGGGDCHITTARCHSHTHIKLLSETLQQVALRVQPFQPEFPVVSFPPVYIIVCASEGKCALDFISVASTLKKSSDGAIKWREG
ncbi:hypothetical protein QQF64_008118 [Cirrhinus molitorella]|uniref:Uncharacterized protein n=1 Tax=Cirrhinus molitorella TaxID=172907 RepID=A0ABR3M7S1_9TELE